MTNLLPDVGFFRDPGLGAPRIGPPFGGGGTAALTAVNPAAGHPPATTTPLGGPLKRLLDVGLAGVALLALSPIVALLALAVHLVDGGPAFYGHPRIGYGGRRFRCLKLRSMVVNGEALLARHLAANPAARREWARSQKLRHDPRVTRLGAFMRRTSLDELPQLLNVLRGEMSLVGPRPVTAQELEHYGERAEAYLAARPGLTGLWQVCGRGEVDYARRVALDTRYVLGWSLLTDLVIVLRTIPVLVRGRGAY